MTAQHINTTTGRDRPVLRLIAGFGVRLQAGRNIVLVLPRQGDDDGWTPAQRHSARLAA
jgi:hypothetical protein